MVSNDSLVSHTLNLSGDYLMELMGLRLLKLDHFFVQYWFNIE